MSNVLLTFCHVNPDSLNGAVHKAAKQQLEAAGHSVRTNEVYQKNFDCCLDMKDFTAWGKGTVPDDVKKEHDDITWADTLGFIYPIWWNERPAKLKGWCDRVLTKGFAWDFSDQGLVGMLKDKRAFVAVTYGSPNELYQHLDIDQAVIRQGMDKGTLGYCGIENVKWVEEFGVLMQDREANEAYKERAVREIVDFVGSEVAA